MCDEPKNSPKAWLIEWTRSPSWALGWIFNAAQTAAFTCKNYHLPVRLFNSYLVFCDVIQIPKFRLLLFSFFFFSATVNSMTGYISMTCIWRKNSVLYTWPTLNFWYKSTYSLFLETNILNQRSYLIANGPNGACRLVLYMTCSELLKI